MKTPPFAASAPTQHLLNHNVAAITRPAQIYAAISNDVLSGPFSNSAHRSGGTNTGIV